MPTTTTTLYSPMAMRNPFVCIQDDSDAKSTPQHQHQHNNNHHASRFSTATSPTSSLASSFGVDAARFFHAADDEDAKRTAVDDEVLGSIARSSMHRVLTAATSSAFASGEWKQRKRGVHEAVYEQRSALAFSVIARSMVPCTIDEISRLLSSEDTDQLNASMIEILGDQFGYAVNVRSVPTERTNTMYADLSIKFVSFGRNRLLPSRSKRHAITKRSVTMLDYVETDVARGTACRVLQSIRRCQDLVTPEGDRRPGIVGDVLAGYVLREDPATKHTVVFFFGTHEVTESCKLRQPTVQTLRKMTCVTDKWVSIVRRRRLGAMRLLQGPRSLSQSSSSTLRSFASTCFTCDAAFQPLLRKKHFCCLCGYYTCRRCSSEEDAEERIGLVQKVRVCVDCLAGVTRRAFE